MTMRKAFTLIELLVVIGLLGMMSTLAIGGYTAVTRGMAERGALDAARGLAEVALQRANIDRSKTYIYFFNEVTRIDSADQVGVVCGVAIAVRPIGRITRVIGSEYYDEFGDLNQSYNSLDEENRQKSDSEKEKSSSTFRLYNITKRNFLTVREGVYPHTLQESDLEENGTGRDITAYGFRKVDGSGTFSVGDEYGQEFAVMRLPQGFTFSSSVQMGSSSDLGMKQVGNIEEIEATDTSAPNITVYSRRPDGQFKSIGSTSQTKDFKL